MSAVTTEVIGRVLVITLDRPPVNAIDRPTSASLHAAFQRLQADDSLSVGMIIGAGNRTFSAGWDLNVFSGDSTMEGVLAGPTPGGWAGIAEYWDLNKPVVGGINGHAVGGGFELALCCDVIVAAEHAAFWLPEMQRGFLADAGAMQRLPRRVPYNVATELMLTGRRMTAQEAKDWGFAHAVVPGAEIYEATLAVATQIAKGAPLALQALKASLREIEMEALPVAMARLKRGKSGIPIYEQMIDSEDALEGPRAFLEKREPRWSGR